MTRFSFILLLAVTHFAQAQPGVGEERDWNLSGYVKHMQTVNFLDGFDSMLVDNLLHNRLNFEWFPEEAWEVRVDVRNRIFYGDLVRLVPGYGNFIDNNNDYFDLSVLPINQRTLVFHSMIDRAYLRWSKDKWEVTAGRQRINWGISTAWNPNDIFNAYSFFDFDYEERPGADALRLVYYTGFASSVEVAANAADNIEDWVAAGRWKFNWRNYDYQLISGIARGDLVLGGGWAGNLGQAGFKGEASYFLPFREDDHREAVFSATAAVDYSFSNSLYLYGSYLYNSGGQNESSGEVLSLTAVSAQRVSARNLIPYRHTLFVQSSYPFHPLFSAGLAGMYFPGAGAAFVNPSLMYSISESWSLDLIGQLFFLNGQQSVPSTAKLIYLRFKWSF